MRITIFLFFSFFLCGQNTDVRLNRLIMGWWCKDKECWNVNDRYDAYVNMWWDTLIFVYAERCPNDFDMNRYLLNIDEERYESIIRYLTSVNWETNLDEFLQGKDLYIHRKSRSVYLIAIVGNKRIEVSCPNECSERIYKQLETLWDMIVSSNKIKVLTAQEAEFIEKYMNDKYRLFVLTR